MDMTLDEQIDSLLERHQGAMHKDEYKAAGDEIRALIMQETERLRAALEVIAGRRQCADNLMSNVDIAVSALDK